MENENLDQNNSNTLAAAREARRKRILENGNNRLGKITGRVHNEELPKIETNEANGDLLVYPDPEIERDFFEASTNVLSSSNQDVFELLKTLQQEQSNKTTEDSPKQQVPQSSFSKFIRSKYPVIIIALIVYAIFALKIEKFIGGSVFSLFVLWEILEFILTAFIITEPIQQNQLTIIIGMFLGLNTHSIQLLLKILGLFNKILRDIAIFIFTFVFIHLTYSYTIVGESLSEILDKDFSNLLTKDEL